jgi:3-oxoadipate enol-lactonase
MPRLAANGTHLYYELHGPERAPVIVLNNGILMSTASWALQLPALSERHRVLLYDCRGQGQSEHPPIPWTMADHAGDLAALLQSLDIRRAHVLGISYGGEVAQAFALGYPERVQSLILADTVSEIGQPLRKTIETWRAVAASGNADRFFDLTLPGNFSPGFIASHRDLLEESRRRFHALDYPAVVQLCDAFLRSVDFTAQLSSIGAPTCILVGELDVLKDRSYSELLHRTIRGSIFHVILGAGHASCVEQPGSFNRLVLQFLDQLDQ